MNNEYESGRYGTHLKYFLSLDDYNDYVDSSTTVKVRPNVSFCDDQNQYVKYNWEKGSSPVVLTATSNPTAYKILTAANIEPSTSEGFTIDDLASITLNDIYCEDGGSTGFEGEDFVHGGWAELTEEERETVYGDDFCSEGYSIFFCYGQGEDNTNWEFPEFQYFTGVTSIPEKMFSNCKGLTSITIPSSVTTIGNAAFHNCYILTEVIILNSQNNVSIVDYNYNDAYNYSAFVYTGFIPNGDYEDELWGEDYDSPLDRVKSEGILIFQP